MSERFLELLASVEALGKYDLDKRSAQILLHMLTSRETEFNHNQLRKALEAQGIHIPEGTFTNRLNDLEAKKIITRERGEVSGLGFREKTIIKLNISDPTFSSYFRDTMKAVKKILDGIRSDAKVLSPKQFYKRLKKLCLDETAASLFINLQMANGAIPEDEYALSSMFASEFYRVQLDLYTSCLMERSREIRKAVLAEAYHELISREKVRRF